MSQLAVELVGAVAQRVPAVEVQRTVGGVRGVGARVGIDQRLADGVDATARNDVAGERQTGLRVEDATSGSTAGPCSAGSGGRVVHAIPNLREVAPVRCSGVGTAKEFAAVSGERCR